MLIHPTTAKSPSMLMFGRQIQSRLEMLLSQNEKSYDEHVSQPNVLLLVRELRHVIIRARINGSSLQQGDVHYYVRLDDKRIWKRHVD